jgi:hypothetical protein
MVRAALVLVQDGELRLVFRPVNTPLKPTIAATRPEVQGTAFLDE